jgi:hypothetical protein
VLSDRKGEKMTEKLTDDVYAERTQSVKIEYDTTTTNPYTHSDGQYGPRYFPSQDREYLPFPAR